MARRQQCVCSWAGAVVFAALLKLAARLLGLAWWTASLFCVDRALGCFLSAVAPVMWRALSPVISVLLRFAVGYWLRLPMDCKLYPTRTRDVTFDTLDGKAKLAAMLISPYSAARRKFPCIVIRTPYSRWLTWAVTERFAERGFHVLVCDCRGRFQSEGDFVVFSKEKSDGRATLEWLARQTEWFSGDVGVLGISYDGFCLWACLAAYLDMKPDPRRLRLRALVPIFTSSDLGKRGMFSGGILQLDLILRYAHLQIQLETPGKVLGFEALWLWKTLFSAFKQQSGEQWSWATRQLPLNSLETAILKIAKIKDPGMATKLRKNMNLEIHPDPLDVYWKDKDQSEALRTLASLYAEEGSRKDGILVDGKRAGNGARGCRPVLPHILFCAGWYDLFCDALFRDFTTLTDGHQCLDKVKLVSVPMHHFMSQDLYIRLAVQFFMKHLGDDEFNPEPANEGAGSSVRVFPVNGEMEATICGRLPRLLNGMVPPAYKLGHFAHKGGALGWREYDTWPPVCESVRLYIGKDFSLRNKLPEGASAMPAVHKWVYDPETPTPSVGGCVFHPTVAGMVDNSPLEMGRGRHRGVSNGNSDRDILLFTSDVLSAPLEIAGRVHAEFYVSSNRPSFDLFLRFCYVDSKQRSFNLCDGVLRVLPLADMSADDLGREEDAQASRYRFGRRMVSFMDGPETPLENRFAKRAWSDKQLPLETCKESDSDADEVSPSAPEDDSKGKRIQKPSQLPPRLHERISGNSRDENMDPNQNSGKGNPRRVIVDFSPISAIIPEGFQLRLQVSGGAFPRFARNLGHSGDMATETEMQPTTQYLFADSSSTPSCIILPVVQNSHC